VETEQGRKLPSRLTIQRDKTVQKQKQFASGQPCNGCDPRLKQKTKTKKQQPTSWIAASSQEKGKNKTNNKMIAQEQHDSHALSDFFHCIYRTSPTRYNRAYNYPTVGPTIKAVIFWVSFVGPTSVLWLENIGPRP